MSPQHQGRPQGRLSASSPLFPSHAPCPLSQQSPNTFHHLCWSSEAQKGKQTGRIRNRWELPCGTAGLAFFAGATSSALDSEKDAVLLRAGVWGETKRGRKSHRQQLGKEPLVLEAPEKSGNKNYAQQFFISCFQSTILTTFGDRNQNCLQASGEPTEALSRYNGQSPTHSRI